MVEAGGGSKTDTAASLPTQSRGMQTWRYVFHVDMMLKTATTVAPALIGVTIIRRVLIAQTGSSLKQ